MSNINDIYFDGLYKDIWRSMIPEQLTAREVDFIVNHFKLDANSRVLDIMCGYGRHAIALARHGMRVTAVDNLEDYVAEIRDIALQEDLSLEAVRADIIQYQPADLFDMVLCMGNSLNFFSPRETAILLATISSHLKPGGHLLINTWTLAEIALRQFVESTDTDMDGINFKTRSQYLFHPSRIETETTITTPEGTVETKMAIDYIFAINELEAALNQQGLVVEDIYSIPGKKKFSIGEPRAYIVAEKSTGYYHA